MQIRYVPRPLGFWPLNEMMSSSGEKEREQNFHCRKSSVPGYGSTELWEWKKRRNAR